MEYCEGGDLQQKMEAQKRAPFTEDQVTISHKTKKTMTYLCDMHKWNNLLKWYQA